MNIGETIYNRVTGEEMTLLEQTPERSLHHFRLPPHAQGVFLHIHTTYTETFRVLEGKLDLIVGDPNHPIRLYPGTERTVPLHTVHRFWNDSDQPVVFEVEARPRRHLTETLETLFALANAGRVKADGSPRNVFDLAIIGRLSESYLPGPPIWLQRTAFALLAGLARTLGHRPVGQVRV